LQTFKEEIEDAFEKRADQNGRINQEGAFEVIDDISVILAFDFESAKNFFSYSNKKIPEGYNIKYFFQKWLFNKFQVPHFKRIFGDSSPLAETRGFKGF